MTKIAFLGTGIMGAGMAHNLQLIRTYLELKTA